MLLTPNKQAATFAVVIPTYNRAWSLPTALESLLRQTYQRWIAVVLDDGSTDETPGLMEGYTDRDSRIHYRRYSKVGAVALNEMGMRMACSSTSWWTRLGSDDYFEPQKLMLDALALTSGADWTYGAYRALRDHKLEETCNLPLHDPRATLLRGNFCVSWANMATSTKLLKQVVQRFGHFCNPRLKTMEDFLINTRLARLARPVFRGVFDSGMIVIDPTVTLPTSSLKHDAVWQVSEDGASSDTATTLRESALTQQLIAEDTAAWL